MEKLLFKNNQYKNEFSQNSLFADLDDGNLEKFLDHFQIWSNAFQKMVVKRLQLSESDTFRLLAQQHLDEELGHNVALSQGRNIIEGFDLELLNLCEWFPQFIENLDDLERLVLVHLVVEGCACVFYEKLTPLFKGHPKESHFIEHQHADAGHDLMGIDLLANQTEETYNKLEEVQQLGWKQINLLMSRLGYLSRCT